MLSTCLPWFPDSLSFLAVDTRRFLAENAFMKRQVLVKHLKNHGAYLLREGRRHNIFQKDYLRTEVPRHREIVNELARKICRDLEIPFVR